MTTRELLQRPWRVAVAARLLYLVVLVGILRTAMTVVRHADVRTPDLLIYSKLLLYAVSVLLIYWASRGKNWARWWLLALLAISIPLGVLPALDSISHNSIHSLLGLLQLIFFIPAMVFLFHSRSTAWSRGVNTQE